MHWQAVSLLSHLGSPLQCSYSQVYWAIISLSLSEGQQWLAEFLGAGAATLDQVGTVVPVKLHQGGLYQSGSSDGESGVSGICFAVNQ